MLNKHKTINRISSDVWGKKMFLMRKRFFVHKTQSKMKGETISRSEKTEENRIVPEVNG